MAQNLYAVIVRTATTQSLGHDVRVTVADLQIVDAGTAETKSRKVFTDLNEAKAYAIDVMTPGRNIVRDAIEATRKTRAHNLKTGLPAGTNIATSVKLLDSDVESA